ncbi:MAG TPA: type II secretion system protein [Acidimicrobiales bacterium]|nr:type II secretion system protein [Acidimicrobiales bacterium]
MTHSVAALRARRHRGRLNRGSVGSSSEPGFTLVEMMVTLLIVTVAFVALAGLLMSSLKTLTVQKDRTMGNELATQAIEDLQRLDYNHLGVCNTASGAPSGLTDPVFLANCTSPTYEAPCPAPGISGNVPQTSYSCKFQTITYNVSRYVGWSDSSHAAKRLAVVVKWSDRVGGHQVTEQSSVRSPDQGSVVGQPAPAIATSSVAISSGNGCQASPQVIAVASGVVQCAVTFTVNVSGIPDNVFVNFLSLNGGSPVASSLALSQFSTNGDGTTSWVATLPANSTQFVFGSGTQFFTFVADRSADGKGTSQLSSVVQFTCSSGCSGGNTPTLGTPSIPSPISIDPSGALCSDVNVSVTGTNLTASDLVTVSFPTLAGPYSVVLSSVNGNTWTGTISHSGPYHFASGTQTMYIAAAQQYAPSGSPAEYGSTFAQQTSVSFGGSC